MTIPIRNTARGARAALEYPLQLADDWTHILPTDTLRDHLYDVDTRLAIIETEAERVARAQILIALHLRRAENQLKSDLYPPISDDRRAALTHIAEASAIAANPHLIPASPHPEGAPF